MELSKLEITQSNLWGQISYGFLSNNLMFDEITLTDSTGQSEVVSYDELCKRKLSMGMESVSKILGVELKEIHGGKTSIFFCTNAESYSVTKSAIEIKMIKPVIIAEVLPVLEPISAEEIERRFISFEDLKLTIENVVMMSATLKSC